MDIEAQAIQLGGSAESIMLIGVPDECPRCHKSVHPKQVSTARLGDRKLAQAIYRCTNQSCQELFIATYAATSGSINGRPEYALLAVDPTNPKPAEFPQTVEDISPIFVKIFNQAVEAEARKLDQIFGIGLRKALEFLVKDYAVAENPGKKDAIRNSQLAACINEYVSDPNVKECAKRAAWLGNDETHYIRKWEAKDVNDLKLLVRLTVNWIDNSLMTKKYIAEMETGKPSTP